MKKLEFNYQWKFDLRRWILLSLFFAFVASNVSGQNTIFIETFSPNPFNNGTATTGYKWEPSCPSTFPAPHHRSHWVENNMNARCTDFPNRTGMGDFLIIDNDGWHTPDALVVYSKDVCLQPGLYFLSFRSTHRFGTKISPLIIMADGNVVGRVDITAGSQWLNNSVLLNLTQQASSISIVNGHGGQYHDYAMDNIVLRGPSPRADTQPDFVFEDENGNPRDEFCIGEKVFLNGTATVGEREYQINICRRDLGSGGVGQCQPWKGSGWISGQVALHDLLAMWQAVDPNWTFWPGEYEVTLAISNMPCYPWLDISKRFTIKGCAIESLSFSGTHDGCSYTFMPSATANRCTQIDRYLWDFGDGNTGVSYPSNPVIPHTYRNISGPTEVCVTAIANIPGYCEKTSCNVYNLNCGVYPPIVDGEGISRKYFSIDDDSKRTIEISTNVQLMPNPVERELNIIVQERAEYSLIIMDMKGKEMRRELISKTTSLDLGELSSGIYLLKMIDNENGEVLEEKIIKL